MSALGIGSFVERLRFFDGQRLFASDLQAIDNFHREMRWLHNQSLHQPGVGRGFAVTGLKGDKNVSIQEGYAIDGQGREIVLTASLTEQVPPRAGNNGAPVIYDLTVGYPSDSALTATEERQGVCSTPSGVIRLREAPVVCWVELGDSGQPIDPGLKQKLDNGMLIRLARVEILNCALNRDVSLAERRNARPLSQPYIACGRVDKPGWTMATNQTLSPYETFTPRIVNSPLQLQIDTSAAGFRTPPAYSVQIYGNRLMRTGKDPKNLDTAYVVDVIPMIDPSSALLDSFLLRLDILVQCLNNGPTPIEIKPALFAGWEVAWLGVEG
jgi:hypothetical protein